MRKLLDALKNYASYTILEDITKNGYAHRQKETERAKTIPILLEYGIVENAEVTDQMLRFRRFDSEQSKENYMQRSYFLTITKTGKLAFELMKWQKETLKLERKREEEASYSERKRLAENLLKCVGLELEEFAYCEE